MTSILRDDRHPYGLPPRPSRSDISQAVPWRHRRLLPSGSVSMTSRARLVTVLVIVGFIALLVYSTLEVQRVECTVTVHFQGERRTATASGATEESAAEQAQTAACGPLVQGMDESIACSRRPPKAP